MTLVAATPVTTLAVPVAERQEVRVAAAGGWTAWSELEAGGYVLRLRTPGGVAFTSKAVAAQPTPIRVSLGVRRSGRVMAAYDTCPRGAASVAPGCRVSLLDIAAGRSFLVRGVPGSRGDALPALSGDTLATVSLPRSGPARSATVVTRVLGSSRVARRVTLPLANGVGPSQLALSGATVAVAWSSEFGEDQRLYVQTSGGRARIVDRRGATFSDGLRSVALSPTAITWLVGGVVGETGSYWRVLRQGLAAGAKPTLGPSDERGDDGVLDASSVAVDGGRLLVTVADDTRPFGIYALPPAFAP